ncbi:hypothetical protein ACM66B_006037 [Microbotryomycetes sp. NB124-2]
MHCDALLDASNCLPANEGRARLVHALLNAFGLVGDERSRDQRDAFDDTGDSHTRQTYPKHSQAQLREPHQATRAELCRFHDERFINAMLGPDSNTQASDSDGDTLSDSETSEAEFSIAKASPSKRRKLTRQDDPMGLQDDCPRFDQLPEYVRWVAGASIEGAELLRRGEADVAINWHGGRHHGRRGKASGFCYVQDVVLAILKLKDPLPKPSPPPSPGEMNSDDDSDLDEETSRSLHPDDRIKNLTLPDKISKVMYIDLDLHHGDGVEEAFLSTTSVLTCSVHRHGPGFFPDTGALYHPSLESRTKSRRPADHHALNVPLQSGASSSTLLRVVENCIEPVFQAYKPDVIVLQCGCDGLSGDPCKEWNLDLRGFGQVVDRILGWGKRTLVLGGGGYNHVNVAKCWTYLTSVALNTPLDLDESIPSSLDEQDYLDLVKQSPTLDVLASQKPDLNTDQHLIKIENAFAESVKALQQRYM